MNYQLNSYVNREEADALKELIFKRVRERSQAMTENIQSDVMELARESFSANNHNPFAQFIQTNETAQPQEIVQKQDTAAVAEPQINSKQTDNNESVSPQRDIGFSQKEISLGASIQNKIIREQITAAQIQSNMMDARQELSNKKSFIGALEFLNSKAAVSLLRTRTDKFEVMA